MQGTMISLNNVDFGYSLDKILYYDLNFAVDMDTRVALVGENGIGKSTFLKLLLKQLKPIRGEVKHEKTMK